MRSGVRIRDAGVDELLRRHFHWYAGAKTLAPATHSRNAGPRDLTSATWPLPTKVPNRRTMPVVASSLSQFPAKTRIDIACAIPDAIVTEGVYAL